MPYKLVCVHPYHGYDKGQTVIDQDKVAELLDDREHHFVRVEFTQEDHDAHRELKAAQAAAVQAASDAVQAASDPVPAKPSKSK
jgi:hypothetical protein